MKILIFRSGAFGDVIVTTPVVRYLHSLGHEIYYVTSERGMEVMKNNPHIHKLIKHDENVPIDGLADHIDYLKRKNHCDEIVDFSESIEVSLSQHPRGPDYKLPKQERIARFNRNFYEFSFEWMWERLEKIEGGIRTGMKGSKESEPLCYKPELFFDITELDLARGYLKPMSYNVLIGMSGSGNNKAWPYTTELCEKIVNEYPNVHIITVGDLKCQIIEPIIEGRITNLSGNIPMRTSMALTGLVDLVIAPDTGIIHAAGCYETPKICILGHTTHEMISKHFINSHPIQSDEKLAPCSPCSFLVYDIKLQCPIHHETGAALCMGAGVPMDRVFDRFKEVYAKSK